MQEHDMSVTIPPEPWHEVAPRLYLGGSMMGGDLTHFDTVVSLSRSGNTFAPVPATVDHHPFYFGDANTIPTALVVKAIDAVLAAHARGDTVLVRCQAGLNRSALVMASVLIAQGWDPDNAVRHLRAVRSHDVLFNPTFLAHVLGEDHECDACALDAHRCEVCYRHVVHGLDTCRRHVGMTRETYLAELDAQAERIANRRWGMSGEETA